MSSSLIRVGVDIGGTFTDVAMSFAGGMSTTKVLTDYAKPERAILEGIEIAAKQAGVSLQEIAEVIHGTTLVTNALIERRGAKTVFVTTDGFRDVIEMRSENRFEQYDLSLVLPAPLISREHRFAVAERTAASGDILLPLLDAEIEKTIDFIRSGSYESVAIGFMHAYANPTHEKRMAEAIKKALPDLSVSTSSDVSPLMRELPRFNTVIANAYVQPQVAAYLGRLTDALAERGISAPVFMLHSGGGLISVETASEQPVRLLESGPAGGAIFAAEFARSFGFDKVVSFDMGGTTAKICLIEEGEPKTANTFEVARSYRFKKGSGMTVQTPVVEMVEIGAGGGSIASVDSLGRIQVGPKSAASEPGPACYQRGGVEPTVTDANLVLGRLDPDNFAGGAIPLSIEQSEIALTARLSEPLAISNEEAAFGVTEMVDENMANAARVHTVENGRDISHFTMIAFGGGAPLHACRLCEKLGIDNLLIPPGAGVGSAIGFLKAPHSFEASRGLFQRVGSIDIEQVNDLIDAMRREAADFVAKGAGNAPTRTRLIAYMRYRGQGWEIPVELPDRPLTEESDAEIGTAYEAAYKLLFGRTIEGLSAEITNWSLNVSTIRPEREAVSLLKTGDTAIKQRDRTFFDAAKRAMVPATEVARADMSSGTVIDGPAVIVERETSTIVTSNYRAIGQADGSLLLVRKGN